MRTVIGFFSMLTLGLALAAILVTAAPGVMIPGRLPGEGPSLDYMSVAAGLGMGLAVALLTQISWSQLPSRAAQGLLGYARRWSLVGLATLFTAVLLYL